MKKIIVFFLVIFCAAETLRAQTMVAGIAGNITVDGKLDEAAWQKAPESTPFRRLIVQENQPALPRTSFRVLADAAAFYLGIRCEEPRMDRLRIVPTPRDNMGVFANDTVEIFFDPEGRGFNYYQFAVTASNVQWDAYFIERGNTTIGHYSAVWESAVFKGKDFWSVEIRVPLYAMYHTPARAFSSSWKMNITRARHQEDRLDYATWSPLLKGFHEPDRFNAIKGIPPKPLKADMKIAEMMAAVEKESGPGLTGTLTLKVSASPAASGTRILTLADETHCLAEGRKVTITSPEGSIALENITFPAKGQTTLRATVRTETGAIVNDMLYPVRVEYKPIHIALTDPSYGQCIFPGQAIDRIAGTLVANLPSAAWAGVEAEVTLAGSDGPPQTGRLNGGRFAFSFDARTLALGDYHLQGRLRSAGKIVAQQTLTVRKLPPAPGSCVYLDRNRTLIVDGKPVFALGWYGSPEYLVSKAINDRYRNGYAGAFANAAGKQCPGMLEAERIDPNEVPRIKMDVAPSKKIYDAMRRTIEKYRVDKNVWWYYLCDEPECRGISPVYLKYQYDFIKQLDPYRPVMIISREPQRFMDCADILSPHPYLSPVIDSQGKRKLTYSPKEIRRLIRTIVRAYPERDAAWFCPQAFRYGGDKFADYPNFDEYNCMLWTAVANGAKGITPFCYNDHFNSVDLRWGNEFIFETIASLSDLLLSGHPDRPVTVQAPDDGVDARILQAGGKTLVMAVNLLDRPITATIECRELGDLTLYGYRENMTVGVSRGRFAIAFAPYQVHLLTSPKMGIQMKTLEVLKARIAEEKAAFARRGNLLYGLGRDGIVWEASDTYTMSDYNDADQLVNGIRDQIGWSSWTRPVDANTPGWVTLALARGAVRFTRADIYTATVEDLEFQTFTEGKWKTAAAVKGNRDSVLRFTFKDPVSASKIRLWMTGVLPGTRAELYEIELYP